jgi:hypothetical protein
MGVERLLPAARKNQLGRSPKPSIVLISILQYDLSMARLSIPGAVCAVAIVALALQASCMRPSIYAQSAEVRATPVSTVDGAADIAVLRAQLEEMRRSEDRLLSTVLAAIGIGFTILVVVNVGIVVLAGRNYERDEKAMRIILREDARELDAAEALKTRQELDSRDQKLTELISLSLKPIEERVGEIGGQVDALQQSTGTAWETISLMRTSQFEKDAAEATSKGDHATAALNLAWITLLQASLGQLNAIPSLLTRIIASLEQIQPSDPVRPVVLESIESSLRNLIDRFSLKNPQAQQLVLEAIDNVMSIRTNLWPDQPSAFQTGPSDDQ